MKKEEPKPVQMCDWSMCTEKAKQVEIYKGGLYTLCTAHARHLRKQKKVDNNI
jgi:hypothetical protein